MATHHGVEQRAWETPPRAARSRFGGFFHREDRQDALEWGMRRLRCLPSAVQQLLIMQASGLTGSELEEEELFDFDRVFRLQTSARRIADMALIWGDHLHESQKDAVRRAAVTALRSGRPEDSVTEITKRARDLALAGASAEAIDAAVAERCFKLWHRHSEVPNTSFWQYKGEDAYDSPFLFNDVRIRALLSCVDLQALRRDYAAALPPATVAALAAAAGWTGFEDRDDPQCLFDEDLEHHARLVAIGTPHLEQLQAAVRSFRAVCDTYTRTAQAAAGGGDKALS